LLSNASIIGFVPVSDILAAEQFFCGKLGLPVVSRDQFALVVVGANGTRIRCVHVPSARPQPFTILGWEVADIHAAARDLAAAGIKPLVYPNFNQDPDGVWPAPGGQDFVVWFNDPDGNILSLSQHGVKTP
jgi:catechol 2,3-dioxygenase-like lactoylglutathione lyase family enzyme